MGAHLVFGDSIPRSRASLWSRIATNFECRRWLPSVHSAYSICAVNRGLSHRHSAIFSAVSPSPQRPLSRCGKFEKGQFGVSGPWNF